MKYQLSSETKRRMGRWSTSVLLYLLVLYTFYMLGRSVWMNWTLQKQIGDIQNQILEIERKNNDLKNLIVYYNSESFREVEARAKLGLKKPGEMVVDVPVKSVNNFNVELQNQTQQMSVTKPAPAVPNYRLWWQYIFK